MKHIYKVPGTNKQIIKKFARIGEASIIYSIGRHRFIELAKITVVKTDSETKKPLEGAVFGLFAKEDIVNSEGIFGEKSYL